MVGHEEPEKTALARCPLLLQDSRFSPLGKAVEIYPTARSTPSSTGGGTWRTG
jgi:hypothetical protein